MRLLKGEYLPMKNLLKLFAILLLLVLPLGASADLALPDDLTVIEAEAFLNNTALTGELTIPDGVTVIGERAFAGCSGITAIVIPTSVTAIEAGAFSGCTALSGPLFLHKGITIAEDAFADCENLFVFIEGEAAPAECFSYIINADDTVTIQGFYGPAGVSELMIPSIIEGLPVTAIGNDAFSNDLFSPNFTSITIPEGVTSIGAYALCGCECLTELNLPSTLQSIGENSLSSLIALPSLTLPESLVSVGEGAISNNLSMTSLNIPDSLVSINMNAWSIPFSRNPVLAQVTISENHPAFTVNGGLLMTKDQTRVINSFEAMVGESCTLPETVTNLCTGVFAHNKTLKSVTLSDIITEIPMDTFLYCTALEEVHLPSALETIRTTAFARSTALTHIVIPDGTVTIESGAFMDCSALTSADIPQSVTSISSSAFTNCPNLTIHTTAGSAAHLLALEKNIPVKLTATDPSKLRYTITDGEVTITGLAVDEYGAAVVIPDTIEGCPVTAIADDAFKSCQAASITIPASVTSVGQTVFYASYQLSAIHVEAANPAYKSVDGVLLTKDGSKLICCPAACPFTTYTVPGTVTSLDIYAFAYCRGLEEVILPDGLTEISERAFFYCRSMPAITIPEGVTTIGTNAFSYCEALTEIALPASVQSIGDGAFDDCTGLTTVSLPSTVTSLGSFVFSGCTSLTDILVDENNPSYASHDGILMSKDGTTLMIHPAGRTYTSFTVPETVTYLDGGAFSGCVNLESITLPDTLTFLTNFVFSNCTNLKSINIPASVTGIHVYAFNGCHNLTVTVEAGSFGESWAIEKGIPYVVTGAAATPAESFTYTIEDGEVTITDFDASCGITEVVIPGTIEGYPVTTIAQAAFMGKRLTSVVIPEGVKTLKMQAFSSNPDLTSVTIPSTLTDMGEILFEGCTSLSTLEIAADHPVYSVQNGLVIRKDTHTVVTYLYGYGETSTDVVIPEGVEVVGNSAVWLCDWMTSLSLPSTLKRIEDCAFQGPMNITTLTIPESVEYIGRLSFYGWSALTELNVSPDIGQIDIGAFDGCKSLTGTLEFNSTANIHADAFTGCPNLTVKRNADLVPENVFRYEIVEGKATITGLQDGVTLDYIVIPDTIEDYPVTAIGWEAFAGSTFSTIIIPEGVTTIGMHAFSFNENLSYVKIPSTLTDMDNEPFSFCSSLAELIIAYNHPVYDVQNGLIIRKATKTVTGYLYGYKATGTDVVIPEGVEVIGECALRYCDWMTSLTLPSTLKRIENIAFGFDDGTNSVTSLTIPESVEYIGYWAFGNWQNLTELNVSSDVGFIDEYAFFNCYNLTGTLEFSSQALIHAAAFKNCDGLTVNAYVAEGATPAAMFTYTAEDGEVTITGYKSPMGYTDITIPAEIDGLPVTAIADEAFIADSAYGGCPTLNSITVPEGVTTIGNRAFSCCQDLTYVSLPSTVTSVGYGIISSSGKMAAIGVAEDHPYLACSDGMLYEKESQRLIAMIIPSGATALTIPGTIKAIGNYAIDANGIVNLTLAEGVTAIESYGIRYAYDLQFVTIPTTLMEVQSNAVSGAYRLRTTLTMPYGASVAEDAFPDSSVTIEYAPGGEEDTPAEYFYYADYGDSVVIYGYNGPETVTIVRIPAEIDGKPVTAITGSYLFSSYPDVTAVYVPEGVTELAAECFRQSRGLETVSLPSTLTTIGESCFVWCDQLKSIEIPDSVTSFGVNMFGECSSMTYCKLPKGMTLLPYCTFGNCTSLSEIVWPDALETISKWAFQGAAMDTLVLPDTVTTLENSAFYWANIKHITLSSKLTEIPAEAFGNCYVLEEIEIPEGVTSIGDLAFSNCYALQSIVLPSTLTSIGSGAFSGCSDLTEITIHEDNEVFVISNGAMMNKESGEMLILISGIAEDGSYTVGSDVKVIGAEVFKGNGSLTSIVIPEGVTTIGARAFSWCNGLTTVSLPSTVTSIAENAFEACRELSSITVAQGNEYYSVTDSMLVSADNILLVPIGGLKASSFNVPEGIVRIGDSAFRCAYDLSSITLPSTLQSIGDYAFANAGVNTSLEQIVLPDSVTSIGEAAFIFSAVQNIQLSSGLTEIPKEAFESCDLTEITLPAGIRTVGQYAFGGCENLTSITLNDGLTTLGFGAFAYCNNVESVYIPASVTSIDDWAFGVTQNNAVFTVHRGSKGEEFCKWNRLDFVYTADSYTPIAELTYTATETAVTITGYTGTDTEVILPEEIDGLPVTAIGDSAFAGSAITGIVFPTALESIGASAFDGCTALVEVTLPDGLLSIGDYAFRGCKAIQNGILHIPGTVQTIGALIADKDSIILSIVPGTPGEQYAMDNGYNWGC